VLDCTTVVPELPASSSATGAAPSPAPPVRATARSRSPTTALFLDEVDLPLTLQAQLLRAVQGAHGAGRRQRGARRDSGSLRHTGGWPTRANGAFRADSTTGSAPLSAWCRRAASGPKTSSPFPSLLRAPPVAAMRPISPSRRRLLLQRLYQGNVRLRQPRGAHRVPSRRRRTDRQRHSDNERPQHRRRRGGIVTDRRSARAARGAGLKAISRAAAAAHRGRRRNADGVFSSPRDSWASPTAPSRCDEPSRPGQGADGMTPALRGTCF
jgi:hypothetical protein